MTELTNKNIAHTITLADLGINIPIPIADESGPAVVEFTFTTGDAGTYQWRCMTPCGGGSKGMDGSMATDGWMRGSLRGRLIATTSKPDEQEDIVRRTNEAEGPTVQAPPEDLELTDAQGVTRRKILGRLATIGIAAGALGVGGSALISYRDEAFAADTTSTKTQAEHAWCMVIDLRLCDGCKACTMACQQRHQLALDQTWIKVYEMTGTDGQSYFMPRPCMMCENPPCEYVCPVGATFRNDEGLVLVDPNTCIGCRTCMAACPYEARYFNWKEPPPAKKLPFPPTPEMPVPQKIGTVGKCVFCADRLPQGELPACVAGCPMGVLYIGDLVTDVATNSYGDTVKLSTYLKENDAVRFKEELGTNPRVYYILGHGQDLG